MLLFSTVLNINNTMTKEKFLRLIIEWNKNSIHEDNRIPGLEYAGEYNAHIGNKNLWMEINECKSKKILAVRYEKVESDGVIWDTDYIMNFEEMKLAIRLDRSFTEDASIVDYSFSTPKFIDYLIDGGYLISDDDLPVTNTPILLTEDNIDLMVDVILDRKNYNLPIVFVSKQFNGKYPLKVYDLAKTLKGIAHVVMQESAHTSNELRKRCYDMNEYNGAVGIYYPHEGYGNKRFLFRSYNADFSRINSTVMRYANAQAVSKIYTWQGVANAILDEGIKTQREKRIAAEKAKLKAETERLEAENAKELAETERLEAENAKELAETERLEAETEKKKAQNEVYRTYEVFDDDFKKYEKQIENLRNERTKLEAENWGLQQKLEKNGETPLLVYGEEEALYVGEIREIILSVLEDSLETLKEDSRRADVIKDVLENNQYNHEPEKRGERLKSILKNYKSLTGKEKKQLEELGLEVTEDGKHYKANYYGDSRYNTTLAKTSSDGRAGKNLAGEIIKDMF